MTVGRNLLALGCALIVGAGWLALPAMAQEKKPNVVFILADNVGYGDLGPYGGGELRGAPTPNIDQLAREGLRLTQFLVEPACTPSRAALMTGQYSIRSGLSLIAIEGSPYTLSARAFTMGELFKGAGYATAIFGKWHLGSAHRVCQPRMGSKNSTASRRTFRGMQRLTSTRSS
jgi:arylsulfatase A-like enzyme